jgi:hypothetical protein
MERDCFGICLNKALLDQHKSTTFTHVRAYEKSSLPCEDRLEDYLIVSYSHPQLTGQDVLEVMTDANNLIWRADYFCPSIDPSR